MEITILCKVVDNFGDIGVVWRLCKRLKEINSDLKINLIVDDLFSFNKICSGIQDNKDVQSYMGIDIYDWKRDDFCYQTFIKNDGEKLSVILECFQCGRPDWMEKILFEDKLSRIVNIIMIDYLTAEKYAEDFHCLKSLTRSAKVQKVNFMPGFTDKTGGLILDKEWEKQVPRNALGPCLVFTYERNWKPLAKVLNQFDFTVELAQGRGFDSFKNAWNDLAEKKSSLKELPFMNQEEWDKVMKECSILFIRGEESMSRACLSGIPFVWHAYPQSDEYQLVKVNALLDRMKEFFDEEAFLIVKRVWLDFNSPEEMISDENFEKDLKDFIKNRNSLSTCFENFAKALRKNGDLGANLMTFIRKIAII